MRNLLKYPDITGIQEPSPANSNRRGPFIRQKEQAVCLVWDITTLKTSLLDNQIRADHKNIAKFVEWLEHNKRVSDNVDALLKNAVREFAKEMPRLAAGRKAPFTLTV